MTTLTRLALAVAVGLTAAGLRADDPSTPADDAAAMRLEGGYTIVSGEEGGKPIPAERIEGSIVRFTKDEAIGTDKDKNQIFVTKYRLDTTAMPYRIVMKSVAPKEGQTTGLIKKEGDAITLIYALPGGEDPTDFTTKEKQQKFVLKNLSKKGKGDAGRDD